MSKRNVRVVFAVLISLAVIVGIYTSVQGASLNAGIRSGQAHVDAGLKPDLNHVRGPVQELQSFMPQVEGSGHHCDDEGINPSDY